MNPRLLGIQVALLGIMNVLSGAGAEEITFSLEGEVTSVTSASDSTADLTAYFSVGAPFSITFTVEMSTPSEPLSEDVGKAYENSVTRATVVVGECVMSLDGSQGHTIFVFDMPPGPFMLDAYYLYVRPSECGIPGAFMPYLFVRLEDADARAFDSDLLPRVLALEEFETARFVLSFVASTLLPGNVEGRIRSLTPTRPVSWGRLKASFDRP